MEAARHLTSDPEDAVEQMGVCIRKLIDDPAEAMHAERELRDALGLPPRAERRGGRG
jgi:hypothetical protein